VVFTGLVVKSKCQKFLLFQKGAGLFGAAKSLVLVTTQGILGSARDLFVSTVKIQSVRQSGEGKAKKHFD